MSPLLADLGVRLPVLAAPMAGGPTTPALVSAAAAVGSLGFLAAGYKTAEVVAADIAAVRATTDVFGINLFAPNPLPVDPREFARYAEQLAPDATPYDLILGGHGPIEDDDSWAAKIEVLLADPVPVVSFTFGLPDRASLEALRRAGSTVVQTVTSAAEARLAAAAGVDALAVQASAAGGHSGTLTPRDVPPNVPLTDLIAEVRATVSLPVLAAGGLATPPDIAAVIAAGADAAIVGSVLLRADESGASETHKAAIAAANRETIVTRAFTGRPARALRNRFIERHDTLAPLGYPAVHHLTGPLRRAAAADGNPELVNLWAGTGYRHAQVEPTGLIVTRLISEL